MLVLTRRKDESIVIGSGPEAVRVTVVKISRGKVRIGIAAPRTTPVHRREVAESPKGGGQ